MGMSSSRKVQGLPRETREWSRGCLRGLAAARAWALIAHCMAIGLLPASGSVGASWPAYDGQDGTRRPG